MKQQLFATRYKSDALIKEIVEIWRQGNQKENLEGVEQDPIFKLLVTALAYRTNEIENNIELMKDEVLGDLVRRLTPQTLCRATPAATIITTSILGDFGERYLTSSSRFTLSGTPHIFVPILDTLIINGGVESVSRVDGRNWRVRIATKDPLTTLRGLSFLLDVEPFTELSITFEGKELTLINPWDYANLPLSKSLSRERMLYNREELFVAENLWFDLFAKLGAKLFYLGYMDESQFNLANREYLDLGFEFKGIDDKFEFTSQSLKINAVPIANITESWVDISTTNPMVRVGTGDSGDVRQEFLGLLSPEVGSNDYLGMISLREVGADRFNENSLLNLARNLYDRFSSDYYAFQHVTKLRDGARMQQLYSNLESIYRDIVDKVNIDRGIYISLNRASYEELDGRSLRVRYITTSGVQLNDLLNSSSVFIASKSLSLALSTSVVDPLKGEASVDGESAQKAMVKYSVITQDRLVTPADIKAFCLKELAVMYGVGSESINSIMVAPKLVCDNRETRYVMKVDISILGSLYIKRTLKSVEYIESRLSRMIAVRSVGIYQFDVSIVIKD